MKNIASLVLIFALSGCSHTGTNTPPVNSTPPVTPTSDPNAARNAAIIKTATTQAVSLGLSVYANEGHQAEALLIAQKMKDLVSISALPYLNGTSGATSAAVNGFLSGEFVKLPAEAQSIASLAAILLDTYLPAPSATAVLDADQLSYIKAFFQGLNDGATQYLGNPVSPSVTPKAAVKRAISTANWFNPKK